MPTAYNNLGNALREQGKLEEAIANCQRAVQSETRISRGLQQPGQCPEGTGQARRCDRQLPAGRASEARFAQAYSNLGNAFQGQGKFDEAVANCRQAVQLKPGFAEAYNNLGNALQGLEKFDEAIATYRQAVSLQPDFPEAHVNQSMPLLLLGNFAEGWPEYAWRWRSADFLKTTFFRPALPGQEWDGSPLNGRSILLHAEQGLGDTIQFGRYASLLKEQGAGEVLLLCPASLQRLMRTCPGINAVFTGDPLPAFDVQAYLLSLPLLLGTNSIERIPANVPYLDTDPDLVERWQVKLAALEADRSPLRVGIVWQGNPDNKSDRQRSVRLEQFAPLAEQAGVRLFSLQKGSGSEQLAKMPGLAIDIGTELIDLADAAAVVRCLDLVISVDTVVAHLAGVLGIPVWLALARVPDWRWLTGARGQPVVSVDAAVPPVGARPVGRGFSPDDGGAGGLSSATGSGVAHACRIRSAATGGEVPPGRQSPPGRAALPTDPAGRPAAFRRPPFVGPDRVSGRPERPGRRLHATGSSYQSEDCGRAQQPGECIGFPG